MECKIFKFQGDIYKGNNSASRWFMNEFTHGSTLSALWVCGILLSAAKYPPRIRNSEENLELSRHLDKAQTRDTSASPVCVESTVVLDPFQGQLSPYL